MGKGRNEKAGRAKTPTPKGAGKKPTTADIDVNMK